MKATSGAVARAGVGIVVHDDVAGPDGVAALRHLAQHPLHVARNGAGLKGSGLGGFCKSLSGRVHQTRPEVFGLADDRGVRHPHELVAHLRGDVLERPLNDAGGDRVHPAVRTAEAAAAAPAGVSAAIAAAGAIGVAAGATSATAAVASPKAVAHEATAAVISAPAVGSVAATGTVARPRTLAHEACAAVINAPAAASVTAATVTAAPGAARVVARCRVVAHGESSMVMMRLARFVCAGDAAGRNHRGRVALQDHGGAGKRLAGRQAVAEIERGLDLGEPAAGGTEYSAAGPDPRRFKRFSAGRTGGADGGGAADPGHPHVHDLDGAVLEDVSVLHPVLLVKSLEQALGLDRPDLAGRERYPQLVALADVAEIPRALEADLVPIHSVGPELHRDPRFHRREIAVEATEVERAAYLKLRLDRIVAELRGQEPDGRSNAGERRNDDLRDTDPGCHLHRVQRPRAAECDQREVARVDPLLHRARADRVRHVRVDDREHPFRRLAMVEAEPAREPADRGSGRRLVESHRAPEEVVAIEPSQHHVGIGDRRLGAAVPVGGRAGRRACALGAYPERPAPVDPGDGAAAGPDGVDVDHRHEHRISGDPGIARGRLGEAALVDDADVGRGTAHVEGDELAAPGELARPSPAEHPGRRPREQGDDRALGDRAHRGHAAVGAHDVELRRDPRFLHASADPAHVVAHPRPDERIHRGGGEPLELPELGRYGGGCGHETVRMLLAHDGCRPLLVGRIDPGEQEAHRDRLHAFAPEPARRVPHRLFVERSEDLARRRGDAFGHREAVPAAHERPVLPRDLLPDGVVLGPLVTADVDDVAVALAGDHAGASAVVGENRVGRDGGAVKQVSDLGRGERLALAELAHRIEHAERRIVGGGRHLVDANVVRLGVGEYDVGERPADIDSDELHDSPRTLDRREQA